MYHNKIIACVFVMLVIFATFCHGKLHAEKSEKASLLHNRRTLYKMFARSFQKRTVYAFSIKLE